MIVVLAILGLIFGSFINALVWRLHEQEIRGDRTKSKKAGNKTHKDEHDLSIVTGRSLCTHCGHELSALDLVPVFSYIWLRGKCRYCGKPIDDTPLAELLTPLIFIISYVWWPFSLHGSNVSEGKVLFGFWLVFLIGFIALALYDAHWFLLPDRIVFPLIALAAVQVILRAGLFGGGWQELAASVWGVFFTAGLFFLIFEISNGTWIGFGDVKLAVVLGLIVGGPLKALLLLFIASLLGSIIALPLLIRGRANARTPLPFGPFLLLAAIVVVLFGGHLAAWYSGLLQMQ